ncbi:transmembrane protein 192-like [Saccoglossus kowalevskii]|uniref:Transmembrane protein 192 n=1 Tax=Saccoglossus kowalevskii TaxID=10224 RepID=A0ABM0H0E2_SACKO|nr:PREDICTED: transmembrane protein 192-like [Saccoglossus kowalevskii]
MVSLGTNSSRQGGYFFDVDSSLTPPADDQEQLVDHHLHTELETKFRPMPTVCISVCQAGIFILFTLLSYILPYGIEPHITKDNSSSSMLTSVSSSICGGPSHHYMCSFSLLVYIHAALWLVIALIERYLRYHHYMSRRNGYLEFYRQTKNIRRIPFVVVSVGNTLILLLVMLVFDLRLEDTDGPLYPVHYLEILITMEALFALPCIVVYILKTMKFNSVKALADVEQDDLMSGFLQSQMQSTDIGFKDGDHLDDILEKQADMIRYLQQHNAHLGRRIMSLTSNQQNTT